MNGVININKPTGISSFKCVDVIKKLTHIKKVGHTGTLDPEASGVLPICIGRATKIIDFIMTNTKEYEVEFKLGIVTDTYDMEGTILRTVDPSHVSEQMILGSINKFVGEIAQVPPMYSALKHNGVRLYELARQGIEVERKERKITIYSISDISIDFPVVRMKVLCSKGTYIRSLCYDIGEDLGVGATMISLKRTANGIFNIVNSVELNHLSSENIGDYIIPMDEALNCFKKLVVDSYFEKLLINGVRIMDKRLTSEELIEGTYYRVYNKDSIFIGVGLYKDKSFKIDKLLLE
ncbi:tRNA pseudouridine(55) synthase TruB [Inconstantimicrobium mannanitabidum]|uniref:tRNA pseudouridine synthase B n=1 Tax=Inconstantimicrobium mannanitabidum TaxID=1604901 RepID=A0ACB5RBE9_9CLOT|nr:tRNA pseudouridine(55) synthase TruB [Clostridium sp. TW13]GKX66313.1 tRNA pseudouridine synthase B [Clostridium sp. TW13]